MWIKREDGSLLNLDNGLLITSRATGCSPDAEYGYEISVVIAPIDDILNFTKIVTFNKREYADKYIESLAAKLGAINYDDV